MASAVRKLTGVGGDIRKIARLLQKEAPPGHMLAYINQEEADLLKARGGSGKPHADTGVPSFEEEYPYDSFPQGGFQAEPSAVNTSLPQDIGGVDVTSSSPSPFSAYEQAALPAEHRYTFEGSPYVSGDVSEGNVAAPFVTAAAAPLSAEGATPFRDISGSTPRETGARESFDTSTIAPGGSEAPTTKIEKGTADEIADWWKTLKPDTKARLGIGGVQSILGAYQISQAMEQARKGREDIANIARPYQEQGKKLVAQAQSGELTPAAQQQLQAAQAQAAQGSQARGGVGAQQAQMAVENIRQQLLQNQYDYGLKVSGIGDQIATGAIRSGMEADRYVNQLASSYASNIARTLSNTPTYVNPYAQNIA